MKKLLGILVLVLLWCNVSFSEITVKKYLELKDEKSNILISNVAGIGSGFFWYNLLLDIEGKNQLYCLPENFVLQYDNYISFLDDSIIEQRYKGTLDENHNIGLLILSKIIETFPCK